MENKTTRDALCDALNKMVSAMSDVCEAWVELQPGTDNGFNADVDDIMVDGYPFHESFEDLVIDVAEWASKAANAIQNL